MEGLNQQVAEIKGTTMVDDRRLYAVGTEKFRILLTLRHGAYVHCTIADLDPSSTATFDVRGGCFRRDCVFMVDPLGIRSFALPHAVLGLMTVICRVRGRTLLSKDTPSPAAAERSLLGISKRE